MGFWKKLFSSRSSRGEGSENVRATQAEKIPEPENSAPGENLDKIDVEEGNGNGLTALHHAAASGQTKRIRELLQKGADVNALDGSGKTPLDHTLGHRNAEYVLRKAGGKKSKELLEAEITPEPLAAAEATETPTRSSIVASDLAETVRSLLNRLRADMADARMKVILAEVEECFAENVLAIEGMVERTNSDKKLHSKAIMGGGVKTWLIVVAVPRNRHDSAAFFASEHPPGYGGYVNLWLNSEWAEVAISKGHSVMAHLLVYADRSVGLGLIPIDPTNSGACPKLVFPEESLTAEDRRLMGM